MGSCVIGIDAGGTMTKAALFDLTGRELACARSRNVMLFPRDGWTERDADAMWRAATDAVRHVLAESGTAPADVLAVAVSGYGSGLYLLDRAGNPVRNGIVSTDGRAVAMIAGWQADGRAAAYQGEVQQYVWPGQSSVLLAWLQEHEPEVLDKTYRVAFCKDFLRTRLCGDLSTDFTDAGSAGLLDCRTGTYSRAALEALGLEVWADKLPEIGRSDEVVGGVSAEAAALTGLRQGTPVVRGTVDMSASALASGIVRSDQMSVIAGTFSIAATLHTDEPKTDTTPMLQFPYPLGGWLAVQASATSASNLEWLVKTVLAHGGAPTGGGDIYDTINAAVSRRMGMPSETMFFPYLFGGPDGAPAGLIGMSAQTGFDEIMQAVFEGIVFAHKADIDRALSGRHAARPKVIRLAGGASRSTCWSEMFADILGLPVEVPVGSEFGALGVAICAAAAVGAYGSLTEAQTAMAGIARRHEVNADRGAPHLAKYPRHRVLEQALAAARSGNAAAVAFGGAT
ncbi:carbohydrate kinase [Rhodobacter sp. Har01]|uniref:FGGY-family carbohydrate kinase n=1 Tax=Rhodobacter sp. Har01 TaxID=2883999 RepID=UPI001D09267A|nr:FGGY-family carbohydrate kinase [Rhodobacter sp. Har01]MCB6178562.1 carbohydrate kinase [Rhodobacter sp. Har01]